ncbi:transposase [Caldicellulosiruptor acetigenus]|uniref:transposase n=1 Tax=Caldicellulosiruptor acetigenus TaxID=301953 RepID=UPI001E3E93FE|nr:transposase [Caldicellulosiruptor acetigenus]
MWVYRAKIDLADAGYDSEKWFKSAQELEIKFLAGINKRNMKNKENVSSELRAKNMEFLKLRKAESYTEKEQ